MIQTDITSSGELSLFEVTRDGEVMNYPSTPNLILNRNITGDGRVEDVWLSSSTNPNKEVMGIYSLSGTTLTRVTGTYDFTIRVSEGDQILFASGKRAFITSITSATQLEIHADEAGSIASETCTIYHTGVSYWDVESDALEQRIAGLGTAIFAGEDVAAQEVRWEREWTATATSDYTLRVVSFAYEHSDSRYVQVCARIVLPEPIEIKSGDELRLRYTFTQKYTEGDESMRHVSTSPITGFPFVRSGDINSDGSNITVTFDADHHYLSGDTVNISNSTIGQYDGTYTITNIPNSTTIEISSSLNEGASTCSTSTPDGCTYGQTRVGAASSTNGAAGFPLYYGSYYLQWGVNDIRLFTPEDKVDYSDKTIFSTVEVTSGGVSVSNISTGKIVPDLDNNYTHTVRWTIPTTVVLNRLGQILFLSWRTLGMVLDFDHPQSKPDGYELVIRSKVKFRQNLL